MTDNALILFLKYPERGKVKTRIAASLGDDFTFGLYTAFIKHLLVMAGFVEADKILAIDGPIDVPTAPLDFGTGYTVIRQNGKDIDDQNDLKQFYERNSNKTGTALYTMKYLTEMLP